MASYSLTSPATRDLEGIGEYIARDNRKAAAKTMAAITSKFEFLAEHPHLHPQHSRLRDLCKSGVGNYLILYRPVEDGIEIVRILHGARDIEKILNQIN